MVRQVLLASKIDPDIPELAEKQLRGLRYPLLVSPKIDGIRSHIYDGVAYSRKNKLIPNQHIQRCLNIHSSILHCFDGELVVGSPLSKSCFQESQSGVMSRDGKPDFKYYVFDMTDETGDIPFDRRMWQLRKIFSAMEDSLPYIKRVPQKVVHTAEEVMQYEEAMVTKGWEGIMIRALHGFYKQGRSTLREQILIKMKRFVDSEAIVLGVYEQETNLNEAKINEIGRSKRSSHKANKVFNGHLGGLIVQDVVTGVEFNIGTFQGITKEQRKKMWENHRALLGKQVKYKYQPVGVKDRPRSPILLGFRDLID